MSAVAFDRAHLASRLLLLAVLCAITTQNFHAQTSTQPQPTASTLQVLLDRAHSLAARNENATAIQLWQQVLLADPKNQEALEGLALAWRRQGNRQESEKYLLVLLHQYPADSRIAEIEATPVQTAADSLLRQAGTLAANGHAAQAMTIYRGLYGETPPDGDIALAYYETEASLPTQRQAAISGLRALVAKYPGDANNVIALGKILIQDPSTRVEGIGLLQPYAADSTDAGRALHQALLWSAQDPAMAPFLRKYLQQNPDANLQQEIIHVQTQAGIPPDFTPVAIVGLANTPEEIAAFRALHDEKIQQAEHLFRAILASNEKDGPAWAGLGFVQEHQQKFTDAEASFLRAEHWGVPASLVRKPLLTAHFWKTMQAGTDALQQKHWSSAESAYQDALAQRPNSLDAMQGMAAALLADNKFDAAAAADRKLLHLAPTSRDGWRGLLSALVQSNKADAAWQELQLVPSSVQEQLRNDSGFLQSKATIEEAHGDVRASMETLHHALQLPPSALSPARRDQMQLQLAGLLALSGNTSDALNAYQKVLDADANNAPAWQGKLATLHDLHRDAEAWQLALHLPPLVQKAANANVGFLVTLANVAASLQKDSDAQRDLDAAMSLMQKQGSQPSVALLMQAAALSLQSGDSVQAAKNYRRALDGKPSDADAYMAWMGLLQALHAAGQDHKAQMQEQSIPIALRKRLLLDPKFLLILAAIEDALGDTQHAIQNMLRAEIIDQETQRTIGVQQQLTLCWLLYKARDGEQLLPRLLRLDRENDLNLAEQEQLAQLWIYWSLRRTDHARQIGLYPLAVQIMEAAHAAFPQNARLRETLAGAYIQNGQPQKTVQMYAEKNLRMATPEDARAAIGAAMAAAQEGKAKRWMQEARLRYSQNPALLVLDAQWEKDHDQEGQAIHDLQRALPLMSGDYQVDRPTPSDFIGNSTANGNPFAAHMTIASSPSQLPPGERSASPQALEALGNALQAAAQNKLFTVQGRRAAAVASAPVPMREQAEKRLQQLQGSMSSWLGTTPYINHRSATQGVEQMQDIETPTALSLQWNNTIRFTGIARWVFVQDGIQVSTDLLPMGTAPTGSALSAQSTSGMAGELQISARNIDISAGISPWEFPVHNILGSATVRIPSSRLQLNFTRASVQDSELSYAGLHNNDPSANRSPATAQVAGKIWGGVVSNLGGLDWSHGSARRGIYFTASAGELTGMHVQSNRMERGDAGSYWRLYKGDAGTLMLATNFFGMAYQHDELYFTYGQGGYFSPEYFLLENFPLTWTGHHGRTLHYDFEGTLGVQDFHQASALYYPLDPVLQSANITANPIYAGQSTLGLNYGVQADAAWLIAGHWYLGAFANANNASNYNQQIGGISLHYTLHRQHPNAKLPTGFFPYAGINTRRIP